ncbi:Protein of unknown function [Bacillus cereus]|uniref:Uncharacterized protein n=1 Tax=Bacillus wiedmannii TaxID=1890302 RepID=A0AB37YYV8_9BACI|nr:Protein of unknown function [Bacillus wiedmannii]SCN37895.1 Protein of unknown function [Bacillus cereus]
MSGGRAPMYKE